MSDLLAELKTSHIGFFHSSARTASSRAALSAAYLADDTPFGNRWIFQDVHSGGAASLAGIDIPGSTELSRDAVALPGTDVLSAIQRSSLVSSVRDDDRFGRTSNGQHMDEEGHSIPSSCVRVHQRDDHGLVEIASPPSASCGGTAGRRGFISQPQISS